MSDFWRKLSSSQIIILGFAALILVGSLLLSIPAATASGERAPYPDALFTATSAVCVTGLVVQDTATYWSSFGQAIIILLIQIGGMGIVTVAVAIAVLSGKKIGLKQRSTMQEAISAYQVGGIVRMTGFIIKWTAAIEVLGAVIMAPVFCREFGSGRGVWYAFFHSISAFCNAGFDLMGINGKFSSLTGFAASPVIMITIMTLIVVGGIGFMTWDDIKTNGLQFQRYRMQTKVVLVTSGLLLLLPAIYFFFFEFSGHPMGERIWLSIFQSVTTRTAGFNTADLTKLSETGLAVMILLMLVGGSPGSTAGGMKTTTLAVMISTAISVFIRREHTHFFGRRISDEKVRSAATIVTMYLGLMLMTGCIMSRLEDIPLITCLFETGSAIGTVGLTLGITPTLGHVSRAMLIFLMYIGRVGGLTLIFSAVAGVQGNTSKFPQENLTVG